VSWQAYALVAALLVSLREPFLRLARRGGDSDALSTAILNYLGMVAVAVPLAFVEGRWPSSGQGTVLAAGAVFDFGGFLLMAYALARVEASMVTPLLALTPMWLVVVGPLVSGEPYVSFRVVCGIVLVCVGVCAVAWRRGQLKIGTFMQHPAVLAMLGTSLRWAGSNATAKFLLMGGVGTCARAAVGPSFSLACMIAYMALKRRVIVLSRWPMLAGLFTGVAVVVSVKALGMTESPAAVAVLRSSIVLTALWGWTWMGERESGRRAVGAAFAALGVAVVMAS
jgi:drug/metabolite transporter (DMT)-like permease